VGGTLHVGEESEGAPLLPVDATLTFSTTIQPSYKHHTTSIEPTKDKPLPRPCPAPAPPLAGGETVIK
jgi:hypothetical protein